MGSGSSSSSGKGTSTATSAPNPQAMNSYSELMSRANQLSRTPYQAYTGELVAPTNATQQTGYGQLESAFGSAQPDINLAQEYGALGASPLQQSSINSYLNPYQNQVVGATMGELENTEQANNAASMGAGLGAGGLFNDRLGVAQGQEANQQALANAQTLGGLNTQNWTQAVQNAQADRAAAAQGAYTFGNLGQENLQSILTGAGATMAAGNQQQQQQQALDTSNYGQWQIGKAYPYQQIGWAAGIDTGLGSNMGGTSTTTPAPPNPLSAYGGLGLAAAGMGYNASQGLAAFAKRGGRIESFADGGTPNIPGMDPNQGAPATPWAGVSSYIPSVQITKGSGAPKPPGTPQQQPGQMPKMPGGGGGSGGNSPTPMVGPLEGGTVGPAEITPEGFAPTDLELDSLAHGGGIRYGFADGGAPDDDQTAGISRPFTSSDPDVAAAAGRFMFPGIADYLTARRPPPSMEPNAAGKIPSSDPYLGPAISEAAATGLTFPGGVAAGRAAPMVGRAVEKVAPGALERGLRAITGAGAGVGGMNPGSAGAAQKVAARPTGAEDISLPRSFAPPTSASSYPTSMRPMLTHEDVNRLGTLDKEISDLVKQKQTAINSVGRSRIASTAQSFDDQIKAKQDEITRMRSSLLGRQSEFDRATQPIGVRNPEAVAGARAGAMGLSGATGVLHGLAHRPGITPWLASAGLGGLEGALGIIGPNLYDLGAPKGTAARDTAEKNLRFLSRPNEPGAWDYARDVIAPEATGGAGLGITGHGIGHAVSGATQALGRGIGGIFSRFGEPPSTPTAPVVSPAAIAIRPGGKMWPSDPSQIRMMKDSAGKWREAGTGHYIPKHLIPPGRRAGGGVNSFADGGAPPNLHPDPPEAWDFIPPEKPEPWGPTDPGAFSPEPNVGGADLGDFQSTAIPLPRPAPMGAEFTDTGGERPFGVTLGEPVNASGNLTGPDIVPGGSGPHGASTLPLDEENAPAGSVGAPIGKAPPGGIYAALQDDHRLPTTTGQAPRSSALGNGLMAAGFAMMGNRSPYFGIAAGDAGLAGLGAYTGTKREEEATGERQQKQKLTESEMKAKLALLQRHQDTADKELNLKTAQLTKPHLTTDARGNPILVDPTTGKVTPVQDTPRQVPGGGDVAPAVRPAPVEASTQPTPAQVRPNNGLEGVMAADESGQTVPPSTVHQEALEGLTKGEADTVRAIAEGRRAFLPTGRSKENNFLMQKVQEYDPNADQTLYGKRQRTMNFFAVGTQGGGGQNIASINTWAQHASQLYDLADKLGNGRFKDWNAVTNWLAQKGYSSSDTQKLLGQLDLVTEAVATEGAKAFAGTNGALADREEWRHRFDLSNPASVTKEKLRSAVDLIEGRLASLAAQYNEGTKTNHDPYEFLQPATRVRLQRLKAGDNGEVVPSGGGGGSPQEGERRQFRQGWGIFHNGQWTPEIASSPRG